MDAFVASRLLVVGNLLRRGAALRYARLLQLSSAEFGIIAMLGGREPTPLRVLATLLGMDKAQLSRSLNDLERRKLIQRETGAQDQRDILVSLTKSGAAANATIVDNARAVNAILLEGWSANDVARFEGYVARITERAAEVLENEIKTSRVAATGGKSSRRAAPRSP